jgi:hypothetical protein
MILEWIPRMRIIGAAPTPLIVRCISWDLLLYYREMKYYIPAAFGTI